MPTPTQTRLPEPPIHAPVASVGVPPCPTMCDPSMQRIRVSARGPCGKENSATSGGPGVRVPAFEHRHDPEELLGNFTPVTASRCCVGRSTYIAP